MYNHNKAQQSKNRVHISWDILYIKRGYKAVASYPRESHIILNIVTSAQTFPRTWNVELKRPIQKDSNKLNANNHRGIIISSRVGKIFVMNRKLYEHK